MRPPVPASLVALVLAALVPGRPAAAAPTTYSFVNFEVPGARPGSTYAYGINDAGQVVGFYVDANNQANGFRRNADGTVTTLGKPLANADTLPQGINANGQIVGYYFSGSVDTGFQTLGFALDRAGGTFTTLAVAGAAQGTYAQGINAAGQIVGYSVDAGLNEQGFLRDPVSGTYTPLVDPAAASIPFPDGSTTPYVTKAYGINDAGQIVGTYDGIDNAYGFLRGIDGSYTKLQDPLATGATSATGINNAGQIAGWFFSCCGNTVTPDGYQGFVLDPATGTYTTIRDPAATDSRFSGGYTFAYGINDSGQVVGTYSTGQGTAAFIATPQSSAVPEPASLVMLAGGLAGLAVARRRRAGP